MKIYRWQVPLTKGRYHGNRFHDIMAYTIPATNDGSQYMPHVYWENRLYESQICLQSQTYLEMESIKNTSMEDVSTRVLEKKRIFIKVKPKKWSDISRHV